LHDLTDRDPLQYAVTVKTGYNTKNVKASGAKVYTIKKELYDLRLLEDGINECSDFDMRYS
jgi:hypothetical protein